MERDTILSKSIDAAGVKARYDEACKKLLANKMILAWIMKSCLLEYRDAEIQDIAERYIEGIPEVSGAAVHQDERNGDGELIKGASTEDISIHEGTVTYDIRFTAIAPSSGEMIRLIINVEAQNDFYPGYPIIKRAIYYCSRMISSQYGVEFIESHYEKIKKVYSIWICVNPPKSRENTISRYRIGEESIVGNVSEKEDNYDLLTVVMICLGPEDGERNEGILRLLEVLLSSDKEAAEKKMIIQRDFNIPMTIELESEVDNVCNLSSSVEERTILASIRNIMETLKLTAEEAMQALKIPVSEQPKYAGKLKQ